MNGTLTLEGILKYRLGVAKPFRKDGTFTANGAKGYQTLESILHDINGLVGYDIIPAGRIMKCLDEIVNKD